MKSKITLSSYSKTIFEGDFKDRILDITNGECSFFKTKQKIDQWREANIFSIFHPGTFDLLTINHVLGLTHSRVLGAMSLVKLNKIKNHLDVQRIHAIAGSKKIGLMVSLDTNEGVKQSKSRNFKKGNCLKPTLDWKTRAYMLGIQSIPQSNYNHRVNLVDYITLHGPECCKSCIEGECFNTSNTLLAVKLKPDLLIVNYKSKETINEIKKLQSQGQLKSTKVVIIKEEENQYFDAVLNNPIKTSAIIERIRS
jgi:hypothetical protein